MASAAVMTSSNVSVCILWSRSFYRCYSDEIITFYGIDVSTPCIPRRIVLSDFSAPYQITLNIFHKLTLCHYIIFFFLPQN